MPATTQARMASRVNVTRTSASDQVPAALDLAASRRPTLLAAGTKKEGNEEEQKGKTRTCSGHGDGSSPHAMPEQYAESQL